MAMRDEIRQQRKKLKGKGIKAHLAWFWEYDRIPFLLITFGVIFCIALIVSIVTQKSVEFEIFALNTETADSSAVEESFESGFAKVLELDTSREEVSADFGEIKTVGNDQVTEYDMATETKITAESANHGIDVMLADAWNFSYYADYGTFVDLSTVLDADTLASLEEEGRIFYVDQAVIDANAESDYDEEEEIETIPYEDAKQSEALDTYTLPDPDTMEEPVAVGILMNDAAFVKSSGLYTDTACIAGIFASSNRMEEAVECLSYLENTEAVITQSE